MNIPNFEDVKFVDKDGFLTDAWKVILQQLFQQLQNGVSEEGIKVPQQTTANIAILETATSIGAIVFDKDTNQFKACIQNGTTGQFKVINLV